MKSRSDIALGKPLGLWFFRRHGDAHLVSLTRAPKTVTVDPDEPDEDDGEEDGDGADAYADERRDFLNP